MSRTIAAFAILFGLSGGAFAYDYFFVHILSGRLEESVGRQVSVVDKFVSIWEYQDVDGHLRFDTEHFRCAVPHTQTEAIAYLREVAEKRKAGDRTPPLLALLGTVSKAELWGPVKGGQEEGVASEHIVILCDRIEKPRERFFTEPY